MSVKITRCPQCQTSFKVSPEHLAIAAGAVRCGSCLHVFQALDHLVPQPPLAAPAQPAATVGAGSTAANSAAAHTAAAPLEPDAPAAKKRFEIDDDVLISDDMDFPEDEENDSPAAASSVSSAGLIFGEDLPTNQRFEVPDDLNVDLSEPPDWQQALAASADADAAAADGDDYSDLFDDGDWDDAELANAEDLSLAELDAEPTGDAPLAPAAETATAPSHTALDFSDDADFDSDQLLAELQATIADLTETQQQTADNVAKLEASAGGLRFGIEAADEFQHGRAAEVPIHLDDETTIEPSSAGGPLATETELPEFDAVTDSAVADLGLNPDELPSVAAVHKPLIDQIEPLPVDIGRFERPPTDWVGLAKGALGCAALLLLFFAQYVFFNFDDLSHDMQARPWLGKICQTGACKLPALDPARVVKISNLIVRTHPDEPNALAVDAILLNTESEPVPVPELELLFSTMEKLPLASRRFKPEEFLAGEMSGQAELPPGRPVHIALAIVEPGPDAVNWTLSVKRAAK